MSQKVRVLRLLEYYGDREWIERQFGSHNLHGTKILANGNQIRECILGQFPIPLSEDEATTVTESGKRIADEELFKALNARDEK